MTTLLFFAMLSVCDTEEVKPLSLSLPVLSNRLAAIAKKHNHWDNDIQKSHQRSKLIETIESELHHINISFVVAIRGIEWKDGIATITTQTLFKKSNKDSLLRLRRPHGFPLPTFLVQMSEEEAAAIKPKSKLSVEATLTFQTNTKRLDFPEARHPDTFWTLTSLHSPGHTLGRFQTEALSLAIGDKQLTPLESTIKQSDEETAAAKK